MRQSFWGNLWNSFHAVHGYTSILVSAVFGYFAWTTEVKTQIPMYVFITFLLVLGLLFMTLLHAYTKALQLASRGLPRVKRVYAPHAPFQDSKVICLLEESEQFAVGTSAAFFFKTDVEYERQLGVGTVRSLQTDGQLQVTLDRVYDGNDAAVDRLLANDAKAIEAVVIRPNLTQRDVEDLMQRTKEGVVTPGIVRDDPPPEDVEKGKVAQ